MNRNCLVVSTIAVGVGLFSGVIMNLNRWGYVAWGEGGVVLSSILFVWLVLATAFEFLYQPARQGRKVVYLTLASFGFLVLTMIGVFSGDHGRKNLDNQSMHRKPIHAFAQSDCVGGMPTTHVGAWNREAADDRLQPSKRSRRVSRAVVVHGGTSKAGSWHLSITVSSDRDCPAKYLQSD